ncbi:hypothetical protein LTR62_006809 [Meristemomyces frigidus]|uniref:Patatin-like phospholipase domain-containing protein n=1 Tax=Meristemomyces frigidus TaxID=1508187 RepID=A0AAN7TBE8_9PEZI|nr:hypothetical protein LTR62_006809 [Meristemomyces frigidus]
MADTRKSSDGPSVAADSAWDYRTLPDYDHVFHEADDILAFASALSAPEPSPSEEDLLNPNTRPDFEFITALNDWKPIHQKVRGQQTTGSVKANTKAKRKKKQKRGRDETREGWTYNIVKYPFLLVVMGWLVFLGAAYLLTRLYITFYEQKITWRGKRRRLRKQLREQTSYQDWIQCARELDRYLGNDAWKEDTEYAYYDSRTIRRVKEQMTNLRQQSMAEEAGSSKDTGVQRPIDELRGLAEACVKNNFAGSENTRLYSETYYGTKNLVQDYVEEVTTSLKFLLSSRQISQDEKRSLAKHLSTNFGRTALCLSGGASFAYYHFGLAKALLDADLLPSIITGTSGGALVAALLCTRTDAELKQLLVPALAHRINACSEPLTTWVPRWWRTGARFDSVDWAQQCSWFCHGSLTFLEAYKRTGRILNVSCVPSDPHSPTILANYLTAPDCVIWSAVLASAAVPGILNPVVLMRKNRDGRLGPYSFGNKFKDGSLRTDIPLKSLNLHFNVNFSIVSQVNPHINLFFFSSRGTVGRPSAHRSGRGWRGGFLGSAVEQYLKLDLNKWLKVLRHLELLPRPLGQDWSEVWLQRFSGTITIWPRTRASDFWYILADPSPQRLAHMIHHGQLAAWPKLKFISNRMAIEKVIEDARESTRPPTQALPTPMPRDEAPHNVLSEEDLPTLLARAENTSAVESPMESYTPRSTGSQTNLLSPYDRAGSPSLRHRVGSWFRLPSPRSSQETVRPSLSKLRRVRPQEQRRESVVEELRRQTGVFWDDPDEKTASETEGDGETTDEEAVRDGDDAAPWGLRIGGMNRSRSEGGGGRN